MANEKNANSNLRSGLLHPGDRWSRVENLLEPGMPDINACLDGFEVWIECKWPHEPKRKNTPLFGSSHCFSQEQRNWALAQINAGGKIIGYIETQRNRIIVSGRLIANGGINAMPLNQVIDNALWHAKKPTPAAAWDAARMIILHRCRNYGTI